MFEKLKTPRRGERLAVIPYFGRVKPLARPRLGKNGIYQPKKTQEHLIEAMEMFSHLRIDKPCIIDIHISFHGQADKYPVSRNYGDIDNLAKAVLDAMVASEILADDSLVVSCNAHKQFDAEDFMVVSVWAINNSLSDRIK